MTIEESVSKETIWLVYGINTRGEEIRGRQRADVEQSIEKALEPIICGRGSVMSCYDDDDNLVIGIKTKFNINNNIEIDTKVVKGSKRTMVKVIRDLYKGVRVEYSIISIGKPLKTGDF
jgi:hypothetical protein